MAGGYTRFLPDEETHYRTRDMFKDQLCTALGGHAAEELIYGEASTGPSNDLEQVTRIARSMVTRWGMSERLGPRTFGRSDDLVFLGREISETRNYSEKIAEEIDDEVRRIIEEAQMRARDILRDKRDVLEKLATVLLDVETLEGEELTRLLESDPSAPWPPPDLQKKDEPPAESLDEEPADTPTFQPTPKPGLAWEGGAQATTDGGGK